MPLLRNLLFLLLAELYDVAETPFAEAGSVSTADELGLVLLSEFYAVGLVLLRRFAICCYYW